jgi:hypothetical protein
MRDILRETRTLETVHILHIICLQQAYQSRGEMGRMAPISGLETQENLQNKLSTSQRLQFININIRFDEFIEPVIRLRGE